METTITILLGISTSFLASILYLLVLRRLKPHIEISDTIAVSTEPDGNPALRIKCLNRAKRSCINVEAELTRILPVNVEGGQIRKTEVLSLKRNHIFELGPYDLKDKDYWYDFRFVCRQDIFKIMSENPSVYLRMRILATDSVSGRTCVFSRNYYSLSSQVKKGAFPIGPSMEIK